MQDPSLDYISENLPQSFFVGDLQDFDKGKYVLAYLLSIGEMIVDGNMWWAMEVPVMSDVEEDRDC